MVLRTYSNFNYQKFLHHVKVLFFCTLFIIASFKLKAEDEVSANLSVSSPLFDQKTDYYRDASFAYRNYQYYRELSENWGINIGGFANEDREDASECLKKVLKLFGLKGKRILKEEYEKSMAMKGKKTLNRSLSSVPEKEKIRWSLKPRLLRGFVLLRAKKGQFQFQSEFHLDGAHELSLSRRFGNSGILSAIEYSTKHDEIKARVEKRLHKNLYLDLSQSLGGSHANEAQLGMRYAVNF